MSKILFTIGCGVVAAICLTPDTCLAQFNIQGRIQGAIQRKIEQRATAAAQSANVEHKSTPTTRRALIITVEETAANSGFARLNGITKDGIAIKRALIAGGFEEKNVRMLHTGSDATVADRPTRVNINNAVQKLKNEAEADSLVMVVVISHGLMLDGVSYLCPSDTTAEAIKLTQKANETLVSEQNIINDLSDCKATQKLLIFDFCKRNEDRRDAKPVSFTDGKRDQLVVIRSCQSGEPAYVTPDWKDGESHSLFAMALIQTLNGEGDLLVGSNDGRLNTYEAYHGVSVLTRRFAEERGLKQCPVYQHNSFTFDLLEHSKLVLEPALPTGDSAVDKAGVAEILAARGLAIEQGAESYWRERFKEEVRLNKQVSKQSFQDHYNQMCYAHGNYLTPAVELNSKCRKARLARGASYRSAGDYALALNEFRQNEDPEPLRLFVTGNLAATDELYQSDAAGNYTFNTLSDEDLKKKQTRIELRAEPRRTAKAVSEVLSAQHLTITEVKATGGPLDRDQWLYVTEVDGQPIATKGWIHESHVHWFPEAAELYIPNSPLYQGGVPAIIRSQQLASAQSTKSERLGRAATGVGRAGRALTIAAAFGAPTGQAAGILSTVESGLLLAYAASQRNYVNKYTEYQVAVQRAQWLKEERRRLMEKHDLEALQDRAVTIKASPWTEARLASQKPKE